MLVAIGRAVPFEGLGLATIGVTTAEGRMPRPDEQLRIAPHVYVAGDPAGPELHTHLAHYQGEMAVRIALGEDVRPDYRAIPRALYTDPEAASVGLLLEQALEAGYDAFESTADLATTAKGYTTRGRGARHAWSSTVPRARSSVPSSRGPGRQSSSTRRCWR